MPVILSFILIIPLVGCASQYHDELQEELDFHNTKILQQLEIGEITQMMAEEKIGEELMAKRKSLKEYHADVKKGLNVFWTGLFTTLKFGMAMANSLIGGIPFVYQLGEFALTSLHLQMTAEEKTGLPPKTFKLPPDFHHIYDSIKTNKEKCNPDSILCVPAQ
ncbi:MAG: hypothetical protein JSU59_02470 [Nitrospirota bacterium]|nr:MAG: hypothetical protein JSU59_02470 [Nitrospirota bacterium]